MFDLTFQLKTRPDGTLLLVFGPFFRVVFGALTVIMGWGLFGRIAQDGTVPIISVVIFGIVLLGLLYEERWEFNPAARTVVSRRGLLILAHTQRWSFDDVAAVEYTTIKTTNRPEAENDTAAATGKFSHFFGMRPGKRFLRYSLVLQDGTRLRIELRRVRDWNTEKAIPSRIAETVGASLELTPF